MWQLFTPQARQIILLAQTEAVEMNFSYVIEEHLLLAITREGNNEAAEVLISLGLSLEQIRAEILQKLEPDTPPSTAEPQLTPKTQRVLELAADNARRLRHNTIGTGHILNALIMGEQNTAILLKRLGLDRAQVEQEVKEYYDSHPLELEAEEVIPEQTSLPEIPPEVAQFMNQYFSREVLSVLIRAAGEANVAGQKNVGLDHLLSALLRKEDADVLRGKPLEFE